MALNQLLRICEVSIPLARDSIVEIIMGTYQQQSTLLVFFSNILIGQRALQLTL